MQLTQSDVKNFFESICGEVCSFSLNKTYVFYCWLNFSSYEICSFICCGHLGSVFYCLLSVEYKYLIFSYTHLGSTVEASWGSQSFNSNCFCWVQSGNYSLTFTCLIFIYLYLVYLAITLKLSGTSGFALVICGHVVISPLPPVPVLPKKKKNNSSLFVLSTSSGCTPFNDGISCFHSNSNCTFPLKTVPNSPSFDKRNQEKNWVNLDVLLGWQELCVNCKESC